ncbi:hypothetical protein AVDCRST_MAG94-1440 [uncultured Leptolyngbya sp.]|uniref:Uncharacterized protein n=1 Tax=uncultured Leptolyngbya sp. TaxID=332963 RepID=A0A6J4L080_9CYAN|nr:hypothetical protein AVDCRST_MAG94-1440 [uncultured Leptolyngbya sp.]
MGWQAFPTLTRTALTLLFWAFKKGDESESALSVNQLQTHLSYHEVSPSGKETKMLLMPCLMSMPNLSFL